MMRPPQAMAILTLLMPLASCTPWTVRPIDSGKDAPSGSAVASTPAAYVDSSWASRLLPAVRDSAVDARLLLDALAASRSDAQNRFGRREANGPWYFLVKGEGIVTAVDTRSRVGIAFVDIAPFDKQPDVSIQIGPVIRGTSLRDATGIVRFSDFVNQLQFADVGNELNTRVLKTVLASVNRERLKNRTISFAGAATLQENAVPPLADLVPVTLTVKEER